MAKRAKMAGKGKAKGKKTGPSSSDRVIKTRSMDAVLGVQELEIEEAAESMEQYHEENVNEHYDEKILSPGESEQSIRRQSEIRNDFSDWLSIANRTAQDINTGKKNRDRLQYPRILIQVSLAQNFPEKIEFIDEFNHEVELEVKYEWIPLVCYNCSGIGHSTKDCRRKEEKQEQSKQVWVPKKKHLDKEPQVDEEGFQMSCAKAEKIKGGAEAD
ncbi:hypothetical protein G4B88_003223 [Cannabis sativa]|uniref:CCHC-type domain-containing protein n=1 Tax=Cannabis sativa TaxID=3483 RepID=A0A7J6I3X5_CANSA|nr:hypothetical protein G4B88_003223 [Cannabis sativa]